MSLYENIENNLIEMANLVPQKTGLSVDIWAEHRGYIRNKSDKIPRVKIGTDDYQVSVSIEKNPRILAQTDNIKQSDMVKIRKAIKYIAKNCDIFLRHYNDDNNNLFDDDDLKEELRKRGDYI